MKRIVVTGAAGLVGSRAIEYLRERYEVHAVVRKLPLEPLVDVEYHEIDLVSLCWDSLPPKADAVFHLAQSSHMRDFPDKADDIFAVNSAATASLLQYAMRANVSSFVLTSTGGLYGAHDGPIDESTPLCLPEGPLRHYFTTKRCAELLAHDYAQLMSVVILRPFFVYGAGQKQSMLVPRLLSNVRTGTPIELRGEAGASLNPIHVDDVVVSLEACLSLSGLQLFNLAGPEIVTIRQMAECIGDLFSVPPVFLTQSGHADGFVADISRMRDLLASPTVGFARGVASLINERFG